jgi:hypothetical protein
LRSSSPKEIVCDRLTISRFCSPRTLAIAPIPNARLSHRVDDVLCGLCSINTCGRQAQPPSSHPVFWLWNVVVHFIID